MPVATIYLQTDQIEEVGDQRTLVGDLEGEFILGFIVGFWIGDTDVTIWRGVNGVGPLALLWCQGSLPSISLSSRCL